MKLTPGLLIDSRTFVQRKFNFDYFKDETYIENKNPLIKIIPFLKSLKILDDDNNVCILTADMSNEELLQEILYLYIIERDTAKDENFRWLTRAYKGIEFIRGLLDDNLDECFRQANLYDQENASMENWWDKIYIFSRNKTNITLGEIGRIGENLSFNYEYNRLKEKPIKEYILNTSAGYDLLSHYSHNNKEKMMIEVKASSLPINKAIAHISRNEFEVASKHDNYLFHFWLLKDSKMAVVDKTAVINKAPKNIDAGVWEEFSLPFSALEEYFKEVDLIQLGGI